tara:strand:+ start:118 stop:294 length:177 start_codon:yes stop_codon:yes gene_type:complete
MPKMTKAQAKKRLNEAKAKVKLVYINSGYYFGVGNPIVSTQDMAAIEKIIDKCLKRLN